MSRGGNWKGSDTGTRLPSMPKPRGRAGGVARREEPADDTWRAEEGQRAGPEEPLPAAPYLRQVRGGGGRGQRP